MFRDLLVHLDGGQVGRRRVQFAADLAERAGARLSGIHVTPPAEVPSLYKPSLVEEMATNLVSKLKLNTRTAATVFCEEVDLRLPDPRWFEVSGDVVKGISEKARYADLVILGHYERHGAPEAHPLQIAHSVVLRSGRPVLVVPATLQQNALARTVVAWDGSREAVRAVHDALPLLRMSQSIQIVTTVPPSVSDKEIDAQSLLTHQAKHEIEVGTDVLQIRTIKEHDSLCKQIEQGHYGLFVMGSYSHPMWLEFIFGGVTQSVLLSSKILVLVCH